MKWSSPAAHARSRSGVVAVEVEQPGIRAVVEVAAQIASTEPYTPYPYFKIIIIALTYNLCGLVAPSPPQLRLVRKASPDGLGRKRSVEGAGEVEQPGIRAVVEVAAQKASAEPRVQKIVIRIIGRC